MVSKIPFSFSARSALRTTNIYTTQIFLYPTKKFRPFQDSVLNSKLLSKGNDGHEGFELPLLVTKSGCKKILTCHHERLKHFKSNL